MYGICSIKKYFILVLFISIIQSSCSAFINCEARHFWDRKYNDGIAYNKCVAYRSKEKARWYDRIFGF